MNFKDKLVSKLLDIGKKHRILVYPMLALVAVVTAISHAICWGRGNGKKMVASAINVDVSIRGITPGSYPKHVASISCCSASVESTISPISIFAFKLPAIPVLITAST